MVWNFSVTPGEALLGGVNDGKELLDHLWGESLISKDFQLFSSLPRWCVFWQESFLEKQFLSEQIRFVSIVSAKQMGHSGIRLGFTTVVLAWESGGPSVAL